MLRSERSQNWRGCAVALFKTGISRPSPDPGRIRPLNRNGIRQSTFIKHAVLNLHGHQVRSDPTLLFGLLAKPCPIFTMTRRMALPCSCSWQSASQRKWHPTSFEAIAALHHAERSHPCCLNKKDCLASCLGTGSFPSRWCTSPRIARYKVQIHQ